MTNEITASKYLNVTIKLAKAIAQSFLALGERLMIIRNEKLWRTGYESFGEFLKETDLSEGNASKLIQVYEHYVLKFNIPKELVSTKPYSTLYHMKKELDTKEKAEKFLEDSDGLTRDEAVRLHRERLNPNCEHKNTYTVTFCRDCKLSIHSDAPQTSQDAI